MAAERFRKVNNNCIRVIQGNETQITVHSPSRLVSYSHIWKNGDEWWLFSLTEDGKLYRVDNKTVTDSCRDVKSTSMTKDDEIFTDLLDNDVDDNGIELHTTTEAVYFLQSCDLILNVTGNPIGLCVMSDFVAITTNDGTQYKTSLYLTKDITETTDFETEPTRYLTSQKKSNNESNITSQKQVCMKIVSADLIAQPEFFNSSDVVKIEDYMFKQLFGHETSLLSSPVILICPQEGDVYFALTKCFVSDSSQPMVGMHTDTARVKQFGWRLFCQITGCVADILSLPLKPKLDRNEDFVGSLNDHKKQDALVICSKNGAVLVFHKTTKDTNDTAIKVSRLNIIDPVLCLCSFHNTIFHSTGRNIYRNVLDIEAVDGKFKVINASTKIINKANVVGLQLQVKDGVVNVLESPCDLSCIHKDGTCSAYISSVLHCNKSNSGETIKNILVTIDSVRTKRQNLQNNTILHDNWIKQLNIAAFLLRSNWIGQITGCSIVEEAVNVPFSCKCEARISPDCKNHVMLDCKVTNQMQHSLSNGWVFNMSFVAANGNKTSKHVTQSMNLTNEFKPNESLMLSLAVEQVSMYTGFEIVINAALMLDGRNCNDNSQSDCLCVPIYSEHIDILYFMMPKSSLNESLSDHRPMSKTIHILAENKQASKLMLLESKPEASTYSTICVTNHVVIQTPTFYKLQNKYGQGTICILNYLLKNSNRACGRINCTEYAAVTMLGQPVYLNVQEHDVDDTVTTSTEASRYLSVSVRCDCATSAAMNEAILRRLMKIKDVSNPSPVLLKDMREKLQSLQELEEQLNEMQQIRHQSRQPSSTVEVVYQKLRNLNL